MCSYDCVGYIHTVMETDTLRFDVQISPEPVDLRTDLVATHLIACQYNFHKLILYCMTACKIC